MSNLLENTVRRATEAGLGFGRLERSKLHNGTLVHYWTKYKEEKQVLHYGYHSILAEITRAQNGGLVEEELEDYIEPVIEEYDFSASHAEAEANV
jgi:hypothetical protein